MRARTGLRTICGVLLVAVLAAQPAAAAAPGVESDRAGWVKALEGWWGELVAQLAAKAGSGSESDGGPTIDPGGVNGAGGGESDGGPGMDPIGASAAGEAEGDGGPDIDPGG